MQELLPIALGLGLGAALGLIRPTVRLSHAAAYAVALGLLATVATGEFKTSWGYLLVDVPLVASVAFASFVAMRRVRIAEVES